MFPSELLRDEKVTNDDESHVDLYIQHKSSFPDKKHLSHVGKIVTTARGALLSSSCNYADALLPKFAPLGTLMRSLIIMSKPIH